MSLRTLSFRHDDSTGHVGVRFAHPNLRASELAIAPSFPLAMAELLPPEVWKGIAIFLGAAK
jgi:hypothetical protein